MKNASYREFLKDTLILINENLKLKVYKRLPLNAYEWEVFLFDRKRDYSVSIMWKNKRIYTRLIDRTFFDRRNTNAKDRKYMRLHSNVVTDAIRQAIIKKDKPNV